MPTKEESIQSERDAALVQNAIAAVFKELGPVLQSIALTPEKLREANKPYEDPADIARELRLRKQQDAQQEEGRKRKALKQSRCTHAYKTGLGAINLTHNFPDNMPRGTCMLCELFIEPAHWQIGPPTSEYPDGKAYIVPEHPLYYKVRNLENEGK